MSDEHPTAEDYRNRAERAEAEAEELRTHDGLYLATALTLAQRTIFNLTTHAEAMAEALGAMVMATGEHDSYCAVGPIYNCTCDLHPANEAARKALAAYRGKD